MLELDGYTQLEQIGHGGLGDVYRATSESTGGTVAIKVLRDVSDESVAWHRTRRELTALVSLGGHAHVIGLLEVLEHAPGFVMEYAPGGSVAQLLDRHGATLPLAEVVLIGRHVAAALVAAHEQGIVHRDVKPPNLLIDAFGQVKLCDFGIASLARTDEFRTRTSAISMRYASPEDLEEDAEVGPAADVYSLGATLLHLAHGAPPTLKQRLAPWTPPPTDHAELRALDDVLAACLQPDPRHRPTAADVLERLDDLDRQLPERMRELPVTTPTDGPTSHEPDGHHGHAPVHAATVYRTGREPAPPARPAAPARRPAWRVPVFAGAALAVTVVLGLVLWPPDEARAPSPTTDPTTDPTTTAASTPATPSSPEIVERPDGLTDLADVVWPLGSIGECLVQVADVDRLQPVACDRPHDLQRFAVGALPETTTSAASPDDAELERAVADRCLDAAVDAWPLPQIEVAQTNPSAATWAEGDRGYQCLIGVPDRRLVGSALE